MKKRFRSLLFFFFVLIFSGFLQTGCKSQCPTYMTGSEVMIRELEMREKKSKVKRNKHGQIKKKKRGVWQ